MKKLLLFGFLAMVFWTCSTEIDMLDNWKETSIVYGLLDQSQPKQYIRIQKAFLGPDNALTMAQNYDSINYQNQLTVWLEERDANDNLVNAWQLQPDTITNKDAGTFAFPEQVVYSMNTPTSPAFNTSNRYHIVITNGETGNQCDASTSLISSFNITKPQGNIIEIRKFTPSTLVTVEWTPSPASHMYEVAAVFHYSETDINGNTVSKATREWNIATLENTSGTALTLQHKFDPNDFYRFLVSAIPNDPNVVSRESDYIEFTVYAAGQELETYMQVNSPSTSVVQERPFYTNINNGYGIFSSRYSVTKSNITLAPLTQDTLAMGQYTCGLRFKDHNGVISSGCQ